MVGRLLTQLEDQVGPIENQEDCVLYGFDETASQLQFDDSEFYTTAQEKPYQTITGPHSEAVNAFNREENKDKELPKAKKEDKISFKRIDAKNEEKDNRERKFTKEVERLKRQKDIVKLVFRELPENVQIQEELRENIKENDLARLERFKKWSRENLIGLRC